MRNLTRFLAAAAIVGATTSCGDVVRNGRAPLYLVIDSLGGIRGKASPGSATSTLTSDVITNVISPDPCKIDNPCPTIFGDPGEAVMHVALKDPGTAATPSAATEVNSITITRLPRRLRSRRRPQHARRRRPVRVRRRRHRHGDERRHHVRVPARSGCGKRRESARAAQEQQGVNYRAGARDVLRPDQAGNEVTATGSIQIDFGNFGDFSAMKGLLTSAFLLAAVALAGCTVHQTEAPGLSGPSGLALSIEVTASPDSISQDGAL